MEEFNDIPKIMEQLNYLNSHHVEVGVLHDDFLQMIAVVNNDGTTINAKHGGYLWIPYKVDGKTKFAKKKSVTIPARRFMDRTIQTFEHERQVWAENELNKLMEGTQSARAILRELGEITVGQMKTSISRFKNPKNAPLTVANKGKDDPLVDTGALRDAIEYRIVSD